MESKIWENKEFIDNSNKFIYNIKKQLDTFLENNENKEIDIDEEMFDFCQFDDIKFDFLNEQFYFNEENLLIKQDNEKIKIPIEFLNKNCFLDQIEFYKKLENDLKIKFDDSEIIEKINKIKCNFKIFLEKENEIDNQLKKLNFDVELDKRVDFNQIIVGDNDSNLNSYSTFDSSDNESISSKNSIKSDKNIKINSNLKSTNDNFAVEKFREQEYQRYLQPNKPWVFVLEDGTKRVVAPVTKKNHNSVVKARDHFLLKSERPSYVTLLSLVRDATCKMTNGIGTRADICNLLKESQFINTEVDEEKLSTVVSGALDRLHYEEDPCIKYDNEKKLWIYLHLDRNIDSEEWFKTKNKKKDNFKIKIPTI